MLLHEYQEDIRSIIGRYTRAGLVLSSDTGCDFRTEKIGIIRGRVDFIDESTLYFMEYLDLRYGREILTYSIHYQSKEGALIFRYDNAEHKPKMATREHKHLPNGLAVSCRPPEFEDIFNEIIDLFM